MNPPYFPSRKQSLRLQVEKHPLNKGVSAVNATIHFVHRERSTGDFTPATSTHARSVGGIDLKLNPLARA
jgi:hypothetical protein